MKQAKVLNNDVIIFLAFGFAILLAIILFNLLDVRLFQRFDIEHKSNIGVLGDAFNGLTAPFISLISATLIFLTFRAQNEGIQKQAQANEIMTSTLYENTFFNLIKNHKEVVMKNEGNDFNKIIEWVIKGVEQYAEGLRLGFMTHLQTRYNPERFYKEYQSLRVVGRSMLLIANFIEKNIIEENKPFFRSILYNSLSVDEKYLIGMIIENDLEAETKKFKYHYTLEYIERGGYANKKARYFPPIEFKSETLFGFYLRDLETNDLNLNLVAGETEFNLIHFDNDLKITSFEFQFQDDLNRSIPVIHSFGLIHNQLNFSYFFSNPEFISHINSNSRFYINWQIQCDYKGRKYIVRLPDLLFMITKVDSKESHGPNGLEVKQVTKLFDDAKELFYVTVRVI